ncbi:MAG: hypothetical protein ACKVY0_05195, partial [Prosthecobacter sp.]|uniref:hypothetical protein n=1 Tax=Prosthecobacter sp. TaxID=1965333 RepID=UPI003901D239
MPVTASFAEKSLQNRPLAHFIVDHFADVGLGDFDAGNGTLRRQVVSHSFGSKHGAHHLRVIFG